MKIQRHLVAGVAIAALFAATLPQPARGQAAATATSPRAAAFDHGEFDRLLREHVVRGLVDYDAFDASPAFAQYLAHLAAFDPSTLDVHEQLAFWINAYNAYTIRLINAHHERGSIRNINKSFGMVKGYGPWQEKLARVGGRAYGLDAIEQEIIRKRFTEPRIHFALVCAALGCPPLRSEAYTGARLDAQLDDQAHTFLLQSPTKNRVDVAGRTVYLSPIFVEFRDYVKDFGGSSTAAARYTARFHPPGPERTLLETGDFAVKTTNYDWRLNALKPARGTGAR